jgi:hypothetical protein
MPSATAPGDYYVGWKLRLIFRLEEFSNTTIVRNLAQNPITPPTVMRGVSNTRSQALTIQQVPATPSAPAGWSVNFTGGTSVPAGGPQAVGGSGDNLTFVVGGVIPRRFAHHKNGFKEADTMECDLRWIDVPFDPLCFRSVAVELYYGTIDPDDYTAGISGATRQVSYSGSAQTAEPLNVIPDGFTGPQGEQRSNLRFQGFVDEWTVTFDPEALASVSFKCSDNTRLFLDQPMPPGLRISSTIPIDQAVAQLLAQFPQFGGIVVQYEPAGTTIPMLGPVFIDAGQMPDGLQATNGGAKQTLSVWDYLVEVATCLGHNIRVEGTTVVIQRIRAALGKNFPPRYDDPFTGRTWGGSNHPLRTFIHGQNCKRVDKHRKYARTTQNIEVRCFNPLTKSTMIARFPPFTNSQGLGGQASGPNASTNRMVHALPGDGRQETKYTVYPVAGVGDQATLQNIAQAYYEGMNRAELGLSIHTKDMASFAGDNSDPDVLDLEAGDHFEFLTQRFDLSLTDPIASDIGNLENELLQTSAAANLLVQLGFDPMFAQQYAATYAASGYQTTFVLKKADIMGDIADEAGIEVHLEGANMVEARFDAPGVADFADATLGAAGTSSPTAQNQPQGGP